MEDVIECAGEGIIKKLEEICNNLTVRGDPVLCEKVDELSSQVSALDSTLGNINYELEKSQNELVHSQKRTKQDSFPYSNVIAYFHRDSPCVTLHPLYSRGDWRYLAVLHSEARHIEMPPINGNLYSVIGFKHANVKPQLLVEVCLEDQAVEFVQKIFYKTHDSESVPMVAELQRKEPAHKTSYLPFGLSNEFKSLRSFVIFAPSTSKNGIIKTKSLLCTNQKCENCKDKRETKYA